MGGKPAHVPTPESRAQVIQWVGQGATQDYICRKLGVSLNTLSRHYRNELAHGTDDCNQVVAGKLWQRIMADDLTAIIFWLKTRARWSTMHDQGSNERKPLVDPDPEV